MSAFMDVARAPGRVSRQRRWGFAALIGLSAVSLGAGAMSLATFTDSSVSTGTFSSGTVDITSSPVVAFTVVDMVPGDTSTQLLTIANAGTAELRYAMSVLATNPLGDTLTLTVKTLGTGCVAFDGTTILPASALDGAPIGSAAQGDQPGDRTLAAGTAEDLCFQVGLPLATGNALQGASSDVTFTFDAEQTANNP